MEHGKLTFYLIILISKTLKSYFDCKFFSGRKATYNNRDVWDSRIVFEVKEMTVSVCVCVRVVDVREPACSTVNALWYSCSVLLYAVVYFVVLTFFISTCRLTNEEARKNWEEYGNPDGPGG